MLTAVIGLHPETISYLSRVSANVPSRAAVIAIDEFVRFCYKEGLRSASGGTNHIIQSCYIAASTTLAKLWFRSGESNALTTLGTPTYGITTGVAATAGTNEVRTHNGNLLSITDCSIFFHNLTEGGNRDFFGVQTDATSRIIIHPRWIDDNNLYFDCGNSSTGRIAVANGTDSRGLIIGVKSNTIQAVYQRGVQLVQTTTAPTTGLTFPATAIAAMGRTSPDVTTVRNIGGFGTGRAIPASAIAGFTSAWNAIQTALGR
jgi:hypothetical protein